MLPHTGQLRKVRTTTKPLRSNRKHNLSHQQLLSEKVPINTPDVASSSLLDCRRPPKGEVKDPHTTSDRA